MVAELQLDEKIAETAFSHFINHVNIFLDEMSNIFSCVLCRQNQMFSTRPKGYLQLCSYQPKWLFVPERDIFQALTAGFLHRNLTRP